MKGKKNGAVLWTLVLVLVCAAGMVAYLVRDAVTTDREPPVLTAQQDTLEVSVTAEDADLLQGITAWDEQDGDVTAGVVVESVSDLAADHTATVTYAAFDRAGNVTKLSRTLRYTDYRSPRFAQSQALVFRANASPDVIGCMTASDLLEGNISNRIKGTLVSDTTSLNYAGVHQVAFRVTNRLGDTVHLTLPVEVYEAGAYNAVVTLTDYLVYLQPGEAFYPERYLDVLTTGSVDYPLQPEEQDPELDYLVSVGQYLDPEDYTSRVINVTMDGSVDTAVPGVYSVCYTVTLDEQYTAYTRLNVVVEE